MDNSISVLIVDDSDQFRRGLRAMLRSEAEIVIAGEATNGIEAVTQAEALQPDIVLMDLQMPGMHGLEATRRIVLTSPHIRVLVLTMADTDESVFAALQAGARGYLVKGALKADVMRAIRSVYNGEAIFGPAVAQRLIQHFAQAQTPRPAVAFPDLTDREREILHFMTRGHSNQELAELLGLNIKTIRNHISNICTKLQVVDRTQATLRARDAGVRYGSCAHIRPSAVHIAAAFVNAAGRCNMLRITRHPSVIGSKSGYIPTSAA
jgi:DNA-binding NarL/FixJ family response regulator